MMKEGLERTSLWCRMRAHLSTGDNLHITCRMIGTSPPRQGKSLEKQEQIVHPNVKEDRVDPRHGITTVNHGLHQRFVNLFTAALAQH